MSDISLDLTGLILAIVAVLTCMAYGLILISALVLALAMPQHRPRWVALGWGALRQGLLAMLGTTAVLLYNERGLYVPPSVDWIDWLAIPWLGLFGYGLFRLYRKARQA